MAEKEQNLLEIKDLYTDAKESIETFVNSSIIIFRKNKLKKLNNYLEYIKESNGNFPNIISTKEREYFNDLFEKASIGSFEFNEAVLNYKDTFELVYQYRENMLNQ